VLTVDELRQFLVQTFSLLDSDSRSALGVELVVATDELEEGVHVRLAHPLATLYHGRADVLLVGVGDGPDVEVGVLVEEVFEGAEGHADDGGEEVVVAGGSTTYR
jgi:hypothetical protein